jgi:hypothetical protein
MPYQRGKKTVVFFLLPMIYDLSIALDTTQPNPRYVIAPSRGISICRLKVFSWRSH